MSEPTPGDYERLGRDLEVPEVLEHTYGRPDDVRAIDLEAAGAVVAAQREAEDASDEEYRWTQDTRGVPTEPREERWTWDREDRIAWHRDTLGGLVEGFTDEEVEALADQLEDLEAAEDRANYDRAQTDLMENEMMAEELAEDIEALERDGL